MLRIFKQSVSGHLGLTAHAAWCVLNKKTKSVMRIAGLVTFLKAYFAIPQSVFVKKVRKKMSDFNDFFFQFFWVGFEFSNAILE